MEDPDLALAVALHRADLDALREALATGADPNAPVRWLRDDFAWDDYRVWKRDNEHSPLYWALPLGPRFVEALVEVGARVSAEVGLPMTSLHAAVRYYPELLRLLLQADPGPVLNQTDDQRRTPLMDADYESAVLLLEAGAEVDFLSPGRGTALHSAAQGNDPRLVKLLLEAGADPLKWDLDVWSERPIDVARRSTQSATPEIIRLLERYPPRPKRKRK